jgi:protein SCO1/2
MRACSLRAEFQIGAQGRITNPPQPRSLPHVVLILCILLSGCARHCKVEGLIVQTDAADRTILVSHKPIEGYMGAMAMPFHVAPKEDLSKLTPGTRVVFDIHVGKQQSTARHVKAIETKLDYQVPKAANQVPMDAMMPDFSLTDQSGRLVHLADFRGRVVAVDFIYTRCPLPDVCPRLSAGFAYLNKHLRDRDVTLLSITIDPQYDTPAVLEEYAHRYGADFATWHFLTGSGDQIQAVAGLFGLTYWPEEGSITHTVATAVIGRNGKLAARIEGSNYRPDQLRALIEHVLDSK